MADKTIVLNQDIYERLGDEGELLVKDTNTGNRVRLRIEE